MAESFPGPQKNKMEFFVHRFFEDHKGEKISKDELMPQVEKFEFAPDIQTFFEDIPKDRRYDEDGLRNALNEAIRQRGREEAIGGLLEKRDQFPSEWEQAYRQAYEH